MPFYLIRINRKLRWERGEYRNWLEPGRAPADVCQDFRVENGSLSVWHIEDDKSNLEIVVTALSATRQGFDPFDYLLFEQSLATASGISVRYSDGQSPIPSANYLHRDLTELTIDKLATLITAVFDMAETGRFLASEVQVMILGATQSGQVVLGLVNEKLRPKIERALGNA